MRLGFGYRAARTARRAQNRVGTLVVAAIVLALGAVAWRIGSNCYLDVRLRQDLADLAQVPCSTTDREFATIKDDAQRKGGDYGLKPDDVVVTRASDCVVRIGVNGERNVDLWVTQVSWPVHFTIESK